MTSTSESIPEFSDAWILGQRPSKNSVDPWRPYAYLLERERTLEGAVEDVAVVFLTNRECPLRCLMCDLWKNTTDDALPPGRIPEQIRWALDRVPPARHVKLYNSGNFFDPHAIPEADYPAIANQVADYATVIVESHPRMIGRRCRRFQDLIAGQLQVAMGLETVHPEILARLNKRMTLTDFARATAMLGRLGIPVRAFLLLPAPFMDERSAVFWAKRSIDFAFDTGVECCVIVPTRVGNGALDFLARRGDVGSPTLASLEEVLEYGVSLGKGRVFVDLWDAEHRSWGESNSATRIQRLRQINFSQQAALRAEAADSPTYVL